MTDPQEYTERALALAEKARAVSAGSGPKVADKELQLAAKDLRLLKRDIGATLKEVRLAFSASKVAVPNPTLGKAAIGALFGSRTVGRMNAVQREHLRHLERSALEPYEAASRYVDEVLIWIERERLALSTRPE